MLPPFHLFRARTRALPLVQRWTGHVRSPTDYLKKLLTLPAANPRAGTICSTLPFLGLGLGLARVRVRDSRPGSRAAVPNGRLEVWKMKKKLLSRQIDFHSRVFHRPLRMQYSIVVVYCRLYSTLLCCTVDRTRSQPAISSSTLPTWFKSWLCPLRAGEHTIGNLISYSERDRCGSLT